jgi:hypothetical protein
VETRTCIGYDVRSVGILREPVDAVGGARIMIGNEEGAAGAGSQSGRREQRKRRPGQGGELTAMEGGQWLEWLEWLECGGEQTRNFLSIV